MNIYFPRQRSLEEIAWWLRERGYYCVSIKLSFLDPDDITAWVWDCRIVAP